MNTQNDMLLVNKEVAPGKRTWVAPTVERHDVHREVHGGAAAGGDMGSRQAAS